MDEAIKVYVDGVMYVLPKSDTELVELFEDRTAAVAVDYAGKRYEGYVSPKTARKLEGYAAMEKATRIFISPEGEEEVEKDFREVIDWREERRKAMEELIAAKQKLVHTIPPSRTKVVK